MFAEFFAVMLVAVSAIGHAENRAEDEVVIVPAAYFRAAYAALKDFKQTHANWSCFNIVIAPRAGQLQVGFTSEFTRVVDKQTGTVTLGPEQKCGKGARYLVRMDDSIVQRLP